MKIWRVYHQPTTSETYFRKKPNKIDILMNFAEMVLDYESEEEFLKDFSIDPVYVEEN